MALSRAAREFAAEINNHDWSDAPYRADRAGHRREDDPNSHGTPQLDRRQTDTLRMNVMWVTAQVLGHADPNFDPFEYAEACGVNTRTPSGRPRSGVITAGLRIDHETGKYGRPGGPPAWDDDDDDEPLDRRPDQVGTAEQRARNLWPADPRTPGFITGRSRNVHRTTDCVKYAHAISIARRRGRTIHEPTWTTTGEARAAEKGICSHCWSA
jgi:hypothetical protein